MIWTLRVEQLFKKSRKDVDIDIDIYKLSTPFAYPEIDIFLEEHK